MEQQNKRLKRVLVGSLVVNFLLLGLFLGAAWHHSEKPKKKRMSGHAGSYFYALPQAHRDALKDKMKAQKNEWKATHDSHRKLTMDFITALRASPFEIDAILVVLEARRGNVQDFAMRGDVFLLEQIANMSADERAQFADALEERALRKKDDKGH